jgi:transcriptional regulator GlxA family with amidase domain
MAYLRRVRLDHAHHDLIAASPGSQTVTAIAYRWGFSSLPILSRSLTTAVAYPPRQKLAVYQGCGRMSLTD